MVLVALNVGMPCVCQTENSSLGFIVCQITTIFEDMDNSHFKLKHNGKSVSGGGGL